MSPKKARLTRLTKIATKVALKSEHRYKVGAIIWRKKALLSVGHNYSLKSVKSRKNIYMKYSTSIHAEVDAIINAKTTLKGASILVVRVNKKGELAMAKPCKHCLGYLTYVEIKNIYYSNRLGEIEILKPNGE